MPSKLSNPVGWFEIYVDDLERAGRFYSTVMERQLIPSTLSHKTSFSKKPLTI